MVEKKSNRMSKFDPLAWGMLFFTLWLVTKTIGEPNTSQELVSYAFLIVSGLLFLSIIIPPLARLMTTKTTEQILLPTIFSMSILGFALGWLGSLKDVVGWELHVGILFGFLWLIAYLMVLIRIAPRNLGIALSVICFILGIRVLVAEAAIWEGVILMAIGVIICLVAIRKIPVYWIPIFGDESED